MSKVFTVSHRFRDPPGRRPQDHTMDGSGWTFETMEHGGDYPDAMPQAIRATDPEGRSSVDGVVVDSEGFDLSVEGEPDQPTPSPAGG